MREIKVIVVVERTGLHVPVRLLLEDDWLPLMSRDQFVIEQAAGLLCDLGTAAPGLRRQIGVTVRTDWQPTRMQALFMDTLQVASSARDDSGAWPFRHR